MRCPLPNCQSENVRRIDSRTSDDGTIGRKYVCNRCSHDFWVKFVPVVETHPPYTLQLINAARMREKNGEPAISTAT